MIMIFSASASLWKDLRMAHDLSICSDRHFLARLANDLGYRLDILSRS